MKVKYAQQQNKRQVRQTPPELEVTSKVLVCSTSFGTDRAWLVGQLLHVHTASGFKGWSSHLSLSSPSPLLTLLSEAVCGHLAYDLKMDAWLPYRLDPLLPLT